MLHAPTRVAPSHAPATQASWATASRAPTSTNVDRRPTTALPSRCAPTRSGLSLVHASPDMRDRCARVGDEQYDHGHGGGAIAADSAGADNDDDEEDDGDDDTDTDY